MRTRIFHTIGWRCLTATTLLVSLGQTAMTGAAEPAGGLNVPPEGFAALFNGKDLTGWHTPPEVLENWFLEDGVLKSPGLVEHYRASVLTKELYRDFILMFEFRMPTISDRSNFLRCATESSCKSLCRPLST